MTTMKKLMPQPMIIPVSHGIFPIKEEDVKKYLVKAPRDNIEIVFFGSDPWSIHILKALEENFDVAAVVTSTDSPVANYFKGIVLTPDKLDEDFLGVISTTPPGCDLYVVASYGKIIPKSILDIPKYGALNVHPSLLPKYRGPSPVPATILAGDKETGITIIKMDEKIDHGPVISTRKISLSGREDFPTLINFLFQEGAELLVQIIPDYFAGRLKLKVQPVATATYCHILKREDGYFDLPTGRQVLAPQFLEKLDRMIRAYHPWPGVWTKWNGKIVKLLPGGLIQMEGKKPLTWKDFLNGYPDFPLPDQLLDG